MTQASANSSGSAEYTQEQYWSLLTDKPRMRMFDRGSHLLSYPSEPKLWSNTFISYRNFLKWGYLVVLALWLIASMSLSIWPTAAARYVAWGSLPFIFLAIPAAFALASAARRWDMRRRQQSPASTFVSVLEGAVGAGPILLIAARCAVAHVYGIHPSCVQAADTSRSLGRLALLGEPFAFEVAEAYLFCLKGEEPDIDEVKELTAQMAKSEIGDIAGVCRTLCCET